MKKLLLLTLMISFSGAIKAKTMGCSHNEGKILIDDSKQEIILTKKNAIKLTELLLGQKNLYVEKVILPIDDGKIQRGRTSLIEQVKGKLVPNKKANVTYADGVVEDISISGGLYDVSFNPYYGIGLQGSILVLKEGQYKKLDLDIRLLDCINIK